MPLASITRATSGQPTDGTGESVMRWLRMRLDDWFLLPEERGNPATGIDSGRPAGVAWTEGNHVEFLVEGATYFARLTAVISSLGPDGQVLFTDWRGD